MATEDQHLKEADSARQMYQREIASLQRITALRAVVVMIIALLIHAQFARVLRLNRDLDSFGPRTPLEQTSTVASFLSEHLDERDYTLTLAKDSRTLLRILDGSDDVMGRASQRDAWYAQQIEEVLVAARKRRPNQIRITLPYFGEVGLPIGYIALSFITALASIGLNLFLLLRQAEIRMIYRYAEAHLSALIDGGADVHFAPAYAHGRLSWPGVRLFDIATAVLWRNVSRQRFTLVELTAAVVTLTSVEWLLIMAWYLELERNRVTVGQTALLIAAVILALLTTAATAAVVRRVGRKVFASTDPL